MAECKIQVMAKESFSENKELLKLLGIDDSTKFQHFLSMFLPNDKYLKYKEKNGLIETKEPEVVVEQNQIKENKIESESANESRQNEENKNRTINEDATRANENGKQVNEDEEIIKSFKERVEENRSKYKLLDLQELESMSIDEIDELIKQEAIVYKDYMNLLKEKHTFEKNAKDSSGVWTYIKDTVRSSIESIDKIIESAKRKIDNYSGSLESKGISEDKLNEKVDEKFKEINEKTIKPLNEAKSLIKEVQDSLKELKENSRLIELTKLRKMSIAVLEDLDSKDKDNSIISNDMKMSVDKIVSLYDDIKKLKEDAKLNKVSYDDYGTEYGKEFRNLNRKFEAEKNKLKIYTETINHYIDNGYGKYYIDKKLGRKQYTFNSFIKEANSSTNYGYNTISVEFGNDYKNVVSYNKYAKFYELSEDQRSFYSVKDLPSYMQSGERLVLDLNSDYGLTIDEINFLKEDYSSLNDKDKAEYEKTYNSLYQSKIEPAIAKTTFNVLKSKGIAFQQRHFGGTNAKSNMEIIEQGLNSSDLEERMNAIKILQSIPIYNTVSNINNINFKFPNLYKMFEKYSNEFSKNEDSSDEILNLDSAKFNENGNVVINRLDGDSPYFSKLKSNLKQGEKIDYQKEISKAEERFNVSALNLIPGSTVAKGTIEKFGKKANLNNQIVLSDEIKNSIKVHTIASIEDMIKMTSLSSNDDQFEDIWGIDKSNFDGDIRDIENLARQGYLPRAAIVQALGSAIYNDIGFRFNKNVSYSVSEGIKVELGLYAIATMESTGLLMNTESDIKTYNVGSAENEKIQALIRIDNSSKFDKDEEGKFNIIEGKVYSEDLIEMSRLMNHLYSFDNKKKPTKEKIKSRFNRTVRNGFQKVSQDTNRILNDYESIGHKFNPIAKDIYDLWIKDRVSAYNFVGIGVLDSIGKGKNGNGNKFNSEDLLSKSSKYNNERLALDELMEFYEDNMIDKDTGEHLVKSPEFYVPWDFTVSGRYMMDSKINMQTGKVATRYLIQSKQMDSDMKFVDGKFNENEFNQFLVGIAQGLGTGIDKKTDDSAFKDLEKIVSVGIDGSIQFKLNEDGSLTDAHKGFLFFRKLIDSEFVGSEPEMKFVSLVQEFNGFDFNDKTQDFNKAMKSLKKSGSELFDFFNKASHVGEETHTLTTMRVLAELDKFINDSKQNKDSGSLVFNHSFTTEADDITSGMILTLMGLGTDKSREFLEKGGVYTSEARNFWSNVISVLDNAINDNDVKLREIINSYKSKGYLTHGFLAEFGKLMDSKEFKDRVIEILKNNDKDVYSDKVINDRVHFKDFYNTVAKKSQEKLDLIKERISEYFVPENQKVEYLKDQNNRLTSSKIKNIVSIIGKASYGQQREIRNYVEKEIGKELSALIDNSQYEILDSLLLNIKDYSRKSLTEQSFSKFNGSLTSDDIIRDISASIVNMESSVNKEYLLNDFGISIKNGSELNVQTDKFAFLIKQFVSDNKLNYIPYDKNKSNKQNNEVALAYFDDYLKRNVNNARSYESFIRLFRKSYSKYSEKRLFEKHMQSELKKENGRLKKVALSINEFKKAISDYSKDTADRKTFKNYEMIDVLNIFRNKVLEASLIELAGNEVSRNMAKSPVMTFIYGSSINTIKRNIANIIGKEAMYNKFIEYKDKNILETIDGVKFNPNDEKFAIRTILSAMIDGDINNIYNKQFVKLSEDGMSTEFMSKEEIIQSVERGDLSGVIIDEDMMQPIYNASKYTYGETFGDTFEEEFGEITASRELIKSNEIVRYSIFKYKLNDAFYKLAIEKGLVSEDTNKQDAKNVQFELTKDDIDSINKKLEKQGFGHSIEDSNGARQALNKQVSGLTGKRVTISFSDKNSDTSFSSFSGSFKVDTENTGAAPVTGIHQLDGRKIGLALEGTGMLNIYDAFYSSSNKLHETSDKMNEEFLNTVEGYSLIRTSLREVQDMILSMSNSEIQDLIRTIISSDNERTIIEEAMLKINPDYRIFEIDNFGSYSFSSSMFSDNSINTFNNINNGLSNPDEVLVRHNQLGDSAKGHTGTAFNHGSEQIDTGLVMALFSDIISAARVSNEKHFNEKYKEHGVNFNSGIMNSFKDTKISNYYNSIALDSVDSENIVIVRNEEAYKQIIGTINKIINSIGSKMDDSLKERFNNAIKEFKECSGIS